MQGQLSQVRERLLSLLGTVGEEAQDSHGQGLQLLTTTLTGVQPPRNHGWDGTVTVTVASSAGMQSPVSSWNRVSMRGRRWFKK